MAEMHRSATGEKVVQKSHFELLQRFETFDLTDSVDQTNYRTRANKGHGFYLMKYFFEPMHSMVFFTKNCALA